MLGIKRKGQHMAFYNRVVYKREATRIFHELGPSDKTCAEISGGFGRGFGFKSYEEFHFPDHDICKDAFRDDQGRLRKFDMIVADQVWEHLDRPYAATRNVLKMLNKGGHFYVCVPFYVRYHLFPVDCSRWSARGLKNLLIECGFEEEKIHSDQWGNLEVARQDCGMKFSKYDREKNSLENDPKFPVVAWALAQK